MWVVNMQNFSLRKAQVTAGRVFFGSVWFLVDTPFNVVAGAAVFSVILRSALKAMCHAIAINP